MTHPLYRGEDEDIPVALTPLNIEGARDLNDATAERFAAAIEDARNTEQLKQIADQIVETTGYGVSHVLSTSGFGRSFALSGLPHAAELAQKIETKGKKLSGLGKSQTQDYHGYRDALYGSDESSTEV